MLLQKYVYISKKCLHYVPTLKGFFIRNFSNILVAGCVNPKFDNNLLCRLHMLDDGQVQLSYTNSILNVPPSLPSLPTRTNC